MPHTSMFRNVLVAALFCALSTPSVFGQGTMLQPEWWFGGALGPNFNFTSASLDQQLNFGATAPGLPPFEKASGTGLYFSPLLEYRPDPVWGGILALGFDGRGGSFDDVSAGGKKYTLSASVNYLSLEPSLRYSPFEYPLYFFGGPRIGFNVAKSYEYVGDAGGQKGDFTGVRGTVLGIQLGAGYEFPFMTTQNKWQVDVSPFLALHLGQGPRSEESWSLTTIRMGVAVKFGNTQGAESRAESEIQFAVRAPRIIPNARTVKETFPMRNYIFFDEGTTQIAGRYVVLTQAEAASFKEEQLLQPQPKDLTGRSRRQMTVYHNILNILGDRMRRYPNAVITLSGAAETGSSDGKALAGAVKRYLVETFGIDPSRITTLGTAKPAIPSFQPGGTRELELVKPEDRRVDVTSTAQEILDPVQIVSLQEDPLDSDVLFNVSGAEASLSSWSIAVTDQQGQVRRFGPFTSDQERISGKTILGGKQKGTYSIAMEGQVRGGGSIRKEQTVTLVRSDEPEEAPGFRFSILFEFDQSKTVATYEHFLTAVVAPIVTDGSSVIIHGHTDIVGEESHNLKLSRDRAQETMSVLGKAFARDGKRRIRFDTYGFGADVRRAPFENRLPEERFYNRTVIIDIVPE